MSSLDKDGDLSSSPSPVSSASSSSSALSSSQMTDTSSSLSPSFPLSPSSLPASSPSPSPAVIEERTSLPPSPSPLPPSPPAHAPSPSESLTSPIYPSRSSSFSASTTPPSPGARQPNPLHLLTIGEVDGKEVTTDCCEACRKCTWPGWFCLCCNLSCGMCDDGETWCYWCGKDFEKAAGGWCLFCCPCFFACNLINNSIRDCIGWPVGRS